jgi:integrase
LLTVDESSKFVAVSERWKKEELHKLAFRTQKSYAEHLVNLQEAFKDFTLDDIRAVDVRQYLDRRSKKVAGNREVSLLSVIFNWARERGLTNGANPCLGVKRNKESPRGRYVTDEEYDAALAKAPSFLQDTMDLALLTGQRVSDVLKMTRQDMRDGVLSVVQDKTGAKVGIRACPRPPARSAGCPCSSRTRIRKRPSRSPPERPRPRAGDPWTPVAP